MVCIHIKQSKTDPLDRVLTFIWAELISRFPSQGNSILSCSAGKHPVFTLCKGRMLTRDLFGLELNKILRKVDLQIHHYNTHSFRIGAATSAKQTGIADVHIKILERWKSDAYLCYIRTLPQKLANLSRLLLLETLEHTV